MRIFPRLYDLVMARAERGRVGRWRHTMVAPAQGRVLEIGAGTGLDFPHYRADAWVVATDPDMAMLERARARAREARARIELVVADAEALPFDDAAFGAGVVALAMCTIPHPERALGELRRVLRPGGALRMLEHVRVDHPAFVGRLQDWITPVWRRVAGGCYLNRRTVDAVRGAGFELTAVTSYSGGYVREIVARRSR
ncbi:MAG: methyltransferase domain-containing protein [Gemmatimonadaceae bacterium]|nr:methyltransferase domain-containing protein [Gemmatimonadaceae bacterium]